ncbi:interferon-induced 35 kDa protein [Pelodytes ibericus]
MASKADFVHLGKDNKEMTEEVLRSEIQCLKEKHIALIEDQAKLKQAQQESESLAEQLQDRGDKLKNRIVQQQQEQREKEQMNEEHVKSLWRENMNLVKQAQEMHDTLNEIQEKTRKLHDVSSSGVERKMVFKGNFFRNAAQNQMRVKHRILYPIPEGTALITFEKPEVASNIIQKSHIIPVEDYRIKVMAEAVELLVLDSLNLDMSLSSKKVLVSNLPPMTPDLLMDKLELFFCKSKNGGGEVDSREFLADSQCVILTFLNEEVVKHLTEKRFFEVPFGESTHQVCVTSSLNGSILKFEMKKSVCNRTVLIRGIPDIMEEETLQDMLEIYFQKGSNGGGEVLALIYCPEGQHKLAVFENDQDT